ncbi:MAG: glycoside hydrolase family 38 C-terminal domain-containing protein [Candidatus Firestonebacteria bacterium]
MELSTVFKELENKRKELETGMSFVWQASPVPLKDPLNARPKKNWPLYKHLVTPVKKNGKNWFYTKIKFPENKCGLRLKGTRALLTCGFWTPFTLWVDGEELWKEKHTWYATGPIADPFPFPIEPGREYGIVFCAEPSDIPNNICGGLSVQSEACLELAVQIDAALAQLKFAENLAVSAAEKELVAKSAAALDFNALKKNDFERFLASAGKMERILLPLSPKAKAIKLYAIGHSHIDMDWMWTWKDTEYCIRRDFKSVTRIMEDYPEVTFSHSQVPTYKVVQEKDPAIFEKVKQRIREGRWENTAATWVEGDLNMADGEAVARHFQYARQWTKENLGTASVVMWEPDTFGHPPNIPQLAKLGEAEAYFHNRCNPGMTTHWPVRNWKGLDGTVIKTFSLAYNGTLAPEALVRSAILLNKTGVKNGPHIWGIGNHGGALARRELENLKKFRNKPLLPTVIFSTIEKLLEAVKKNEKLLPENSGEVFSLFEGCFTTHASVKRENRKCEGALLTAEALSAMAGLDSREALAEAWKPVLFSQFHDIFDGSSTHGPYADVTKRACFSLAAAKTVKEKALERLSSIKKTGKSLTIYNASGFERSEPVCVKLPAGVNSLIDADGRSLPVQKLGKEAVFFAEKVPAYSKKTYKLSKEKLKNLLPVKVSAEHGPEGVDDNFKIETECYTAQLQKASGIIASYFDKGLKKELVAQGISKFQQHIRTTRAELALNVFQIIDESKNTMSAWNINEIMREENLILGAAVKLLEAGPVFARFSVTRKFRSSKISEEIIFYRETKRVDFNIRVDWREKGCEEKGVPQLKISFAGNVSAAKAKFEGPYSVVERTADGTEQPTQKFVDVAGENFGFTVLNDSKYGCDVLGGRARMTLLRNPYMPDPETDNGKHFIKIGFLPHQAGLADSELIKAGISFNRPLETAITADAARTPSPGLKIEGAPSVLCTALKNAEYSKGRIYRFFETSGKPCTAFIRMQGGRNAEEVNFLERAAGKAIRVKDGKLILKFRGYEVKTIRV